jgi:hypothetical protein
MTDYLNRFGGVTNTGSDVIDFGEIDSRAAMRSHRTGEAEEETVVFTAKDVGPTVAVTARLQDSESSASGFTDLVVAQAVTGPSGDFVWLPFPKTHKRYVRAALGAALSAGTVTARIEAGTSRG